MRRSALRDIRAWLAILSYADECCL